MSEENKNAGETTHIRTIGVKLWNSHVNALGVIFKAINDVTLKDGHSEQLTYFFHWLRKQYDLIQWKMLKLQPEPQTG